jgi:hypothetical protein
MLGYTAIASLAVLAPQWHTNHARNAKVLVIELPQAQELINDSLLLGQAAKFGNIARFIKHGTEIEVSTKRI